LELLQIWLNLPAKKKMAPPYFTMLWADGIPIRSSTDDRGRETQVVCIAGDLPGVQGALPVLPPDSWASEPGSDVAIWMITMQPGARWTLPAATHRETRRKLFFYKGSDVSVSEITVRQPAGIELQSHHPAELINGTATAEFLLLQGRPIAEPVAQHGPFVMNSQSELTEAFDAYRRTQFGGWPFNDAAPVHGDSSRGRFAKHASGHIEAPPRRRLPR
jgi:redox-sensitive bicupin YhaK (pirin superfamily)